MTLTGESVIVLPSVTEQSIWLPIADTATDGTPINPTTGGVAVCFTGGDDPTSWTNVSWSSDTVVDDGVTYYLVEVPLGTGVGRLTIPKGYWFLWIKLLFTSPNAIIRHSSIYMY